MYESDISAAAGNEVNAVEIPDDVNVIATYPIAVVTGAPNAELAAEFVAYVTGPEGQATLDGVRVHAAPTSIDALSAPTPPVGSSPASASCSSRCRWSRC